MTTLYVPVNSLERANELSRIFYLLTNPLEERITKYYSSPITNPSTGEVRLPIDSEEFYIHPEANKHLLDEYLQVFVTANLLTQGDITAIQDLIEESRDIKVNLINALPAIWYQQLKSYEVLESEGWFGNMVEPEAF